MSKVWVLQHTPCETLGTIADVLETTGISSQTVRVFEGAPVPKSIGDANGLIVMGGPMGVHDQSHCPFLTEEMRLIGQALQEERPVMGICLGSQLLAATLGAPVIKGERKEIGWYSVTLGESAKSDVLWADVEASFMAYHWHGDVFELPRNAVPLASSSLTRTQAFRYGHHTYGFLFHMEVTKKIIQGMVATFTDELQEAKVDGDEILHQAEDYLPRLQRIGSLVFKRWANTVTRASS
ncbi:MAG: type 1 glutamine amidotransferase [Candidatus Binatia bacterium]